MTTLSDGTTDIDLSNDMDWQDEHEWSPVVQTVTYSLTGAPIIESAKKTAGRPITLAASESPYAGLMTRSTLTQLETWAATPGQTLTLVLRNTSYTVMFRHQDTPAVSSKPVIGYSNPTDTDMYVTTLKFMVTE